MVSIPTQMSYVYANAHCAVLCVNAWCKFGASVTSIYAILRPVCLFGTLYLFGGSLSSGVRLDRDSIRVLLGVK
jgi:hypothetical protein